jgi:hypothetical protein
MEGYQVVKKVLIALIVLFLFSLVLTSPAPAQEKAGEEKLLQCISALARIQAYVEFYYMETGVYPRNLKELEKVFNEEATKKNDEVIFPKDPATGKEFIYEPSKDAKGYTLSSPDPSLYGLKKLSLSSVNWGWMNMIAEEKKKKAYAYFCKYNMDMIAMLIKKYNDDEKKMPQALKDLLPKYLKALPSCPSTGKEYVFSVTGKDYVISCPNCREHGFSAFELNSKTGFKAEPLASQKPDIEDKARLKPNPGAPNLAPAPAGTPAPKPSKRPK